MNHSDAHFYRFKKELTFIGFFIQFSSLYKNHLNYLKLKWLIFKPTRGPGLCKFTAFQNVKIKVFPELAGTFK